MRPNLPTPVTRRTAGHPAASSAVHQFYNELIGEDEIPEMLIEKLSAALDLGTYAPVEDAALTGTPTAPTAAPGTDTTQVATTEFVGTAVDNATSALLDVGAPMVSGTWVGPMFSVITSVTPALENFAYASPMLVGADGTIDQLIGEVTTGQVGGSFDIGVWGNLDGDLYPGALIGGATGVDATSAALKIAAVEAAVTAGQIVWFVVINRSTGTHPTFRGGSGLGGGFTVARSSVNLLSVPYSGVALSGISAGLPDPFPTVGATKGTTAVVRVNGRVQ